jgi:hypothetical protein
MQLSAKHFTEIVKRLDAADPKFTSNDKRRARRVELRSRVTIIPYVDGHARDGVGVELRDISTRGIRFLHSQPMAHGTQFVLELPQASGEPMTILCTVAHSEPTSEGPFSTGAEFTCALQTGGKIGKATPQPTGQDRLNEQERIRHSILD